MDQATFTRQLAEEGFNEILTKTSPPGKFLGAHSHPFAVKALVLQGDITLGIADRLTTYHAGEVFTLPLGCEHTERCGAQGFSYLVGRKHG